METSLLRVGWKSSASLSLAGGAEWRRAWLGGTIPTRRGCSLLERFFYLPVRRE